MLIQNGEENSNSLNSAPSGGGVIKNKSSLIFNSQGQQATATKSLNGAFGSGSTAAPLSTPQYSSQRIYGGSNQLKKGPSFNQMQKIISPPIDSRSSHSNYQSQEVLPSNSRLGFKSTTSNAASKAYQRLSHSGSDQR